MNKSLLRWRHSIVVAALALAMLFVMATSATYAVDSGANSKPSLKQLRDKYNEAGNCPIGLDTFQTLVNVDAYTPGVYTNAAKTYAQKYINFMRYQAGVGEISLDTSLNANAAQGALIMAKNKLFAHEQPVPTGVSASAAAPGQYATANSNISSLYSSSPTYATNIIESAILGQMKDDSGSNLERVGHRRWLLAASTSTMGIGSAMQDTRVDGWYTAYTSVRVLTKSVNYSATYGTVQKSNSTNYDFVAWPASGYMLNTVFDPTTPWSVMLNESKYSQIPDNVVVTIKRKTDNKTWMLDKTCTLVASSGYINANYLKISNNSNSSIIGEGHCLIFCPNPNELGRGKLTDEFDVTISNLKTKTGASTSIEYTVKFKDLEPNMNEMNITLNDTSKEYTGSALTTTAKVMYESTRLTEGTDYTLSYINNINVGTAKVIITGKGKYKGSVEKTFSITPKKISAPTAEAGLTYTGNEQVGVTETQYYTVTNGSYTNAGNYTATAILKDKANTCWMDNSTANRSINWSIAKAIITNSNIQHSIPSGEFTYNGAAIEPDVSLIIGNKIIDDSNYTVAYSNNINAAGSTAANPPTVIITGKSNCTGSVSIPFTIARKPLTANMISGVTNREYTGDAIKQDSIVVKDGARVLSSNDYELSYSNNVNAGNNSKVTISGKGNYTGSIQKSFSITPKSINGAMFTLTPEVVVYDGNEKTPATTVKLNDKVLTRGSDYSVNYENNRNAGTAKAIVRGIGNYKDSIEGNFEISAKPLTDAMVGNIGDVTYNGTEQKPEPLVKDRTKSMVKGTDYTVEYKNNVNAGDAIVSVAGKGNYKGNTSATFRILRKDINGAGVEVSPNTIPEQILEGESVSPALLVKYNGKSLTSNDFNLEYANNKAEGTGSATVIGKGNFNGSKTLTFSIISKERAQLRSLIQDLEKDLEGETDKEYVSAINEALEEARAADTATADSEFISSIINNVRAKKEAAEKARNAKKEAAARAAQKGADGTPLGKGASAVVAEAAITASASDEGPEGSQFAPLQLRSTKQAKTSIKLTWSGVSGASRYVIYGNACGKYNRMNKLTTWTGRTFTVKTLANGKALKKGTYHKFMVVALDANNNVVSTSKVVHVVTKGNKKIANPTKVTTKKPKALKKGKTFKLGAKQVGKKVKKHRGLCYETSNPNVAIVSKKGVVKAVGKGTCYVYAYAQNGVFKKVKITVK